MTYILIIILALLSSWEELQQLVQRGSWRKDIFYNFLFWETKWDSKWKLFDSHHFAFGLFVLVMMSGFGFIGKINLISDILPDISALIMSGLNFIALWWFFFYIRNLGLHIIFRRRYYREWEYLSPIKF